MERSVAGVSPLLIPALTLEMALGKPVNPYRGLQVGCPQEKANRQWL